MRKILPSGKHPSRLLFTQRTAIFENLVLPMLEDQMMPTKKRVMCWRYTVIFTHQRLKTCRVKSSIEGYFLTTCIIDSFQLIFAVEDKENQ